MYKKNSIQSQSVLVVFFDIFRRYDIECDEYVDLFAFTLVYLFRSYHFQHTLFWRLTHTTQLIWIILLNILCLEVYFRWITNRAHCLSSHREKWNILALLIQEKSMEGGESFTFKYPVQSQFKRLFKWFATIILIKMNPHSLILKWICNILL